MPDGRSIEGRLQTVLDRVARAVDDCGNSLNKYRNTGGLVKFFKSGDWEDKFTGHAKRFDGLKQDLRDAIAIRSARTVENVSRKLDAIYDMISTKTNQEAELAVAVDSRGGIAACVSNSATIRELMERTDDAKKGAGTVAQVLHDVRASLSELLDENRMAYTVLLEARKNEITDAIRGSEERLRDALEVRAYMRVKDSKWSMNVGTSEFIAAVFDYFSEQYARAKAVLSQESHLPVQDRPAQTLADLVVWHLITAPDPADLRRPSQICQTKPSPV
ncbi:hypothetical protein EXIGLDRAFT_810439 [Exidia glandulosa HHB12029]|uniref:Uncharacterized protein n=1 Tax=Exidia glandulosa HHB12029 TaxID=1314781 RepID=A0A165LJZ3_EXIGL|nr:hypothetical protein EXIGLDRAFT_810439 [Exidia glandulosa HHB12029]